MQAEKLKKSPPKRNRLLFMTLWILGHGLAWLPFFMVSNSGGAGDELGLVVWVGGFIGGITSLTQYALIRWYFGRNLKWWLPLSLVAWIGAAIFPFVYLVDELPFNQIGLTLQMLSLATPAAIVQAFLLRKHVRQAWLWVLATITGLIVFSLSVTTLNDLFFDTDFIIAAVSYGLFALTTASTLLWLFGMSQQANKMKNIADAETRLADTSSDVDTISDEQQHRTAKSRHL
ncbi:MAG: hypothetical protein AAF846_19885 [Chloroflexota bacterium]